MATADQEAQARQLIAEHGGRQTRPRIQVLTALLSSDQARTHAEIKQQLDGIDRVSIYRALDWLTEQELAFRMTDAQGIRRYGSQASDEDHQHPHFQCTECGSTTCLEKAQSPKVNLPRGYQLTETVVLVKGVCKDCNS